MAAAQIAYNVTALAHSFSRDRAGAITMLFAASLALIATVAAGAVDFGFMLRQKQVLQTAADNAAIAAAKTLSLSDHRKSNAAAVAKAVAETYVKVNGSGAHGGSFSVSAIVISDPLTVRVKVSQAASTVFSSKFGMQVSDIKVSSAARVVGKPNICLLGLDSSEKDTIKIDKSSLVRGNSCSAFSNSSSSKGIAVKQESILTVDSVCSAGGVDVDGAVDGEVYTDCPQFDDPLSHLAAPPVSSCTFNNIVVEDATKQLSPGTYCGGLKIDGVSNVTLLPGQYIIKGGKLELKGESTLKGKDISIYLDEDASLKFHKKSAVSLEARTTGTTAGILFFSSRSQTDKNKHEISSSNAQNLVGTMYFPQGSLSIGSYFEGGADVGSSAAYTAIVARKIKVRNKSRLTLNSDYDLTNVPVPAGIGGVGQPVTLVE